MHKCSSCNIDVRNVFEEHDNVLQPEAGLHIAVYTGYEMFNDILEEDIGKLMSNLVFCHDCSNKFVDMLHPDLQYHFRAGHPNTMCGDNYKEMGCNYSWNVKRNVLSNN